MVSHVTTKPGYCEKVLEDGSKCGAEFTPTGNRQRFCEEHTGKKKKSTGTTPAKSKDKKVPRGTGKGRNGSSPRMIPWAERLKALIDEMTTIEGQMAELKESHKEKSTEAITLMKQGAEI